MGEKQENFFTKKDKNLLKVMTVIFLFFVVVVNFKQVMALPIFIRSVPEVVHYKIDSIKSDSKDKEEAQEEKEEEEENEEREEVEEKEESYEVCEKDEVVIDVINISAPIVETEGLYSDDYKDALNNGVVRFPDSAYPGEEGLSVLLGHSAPLGWPDIRYDRVFTEIDKLKEGDVIEICYNNKLYKYTVIDEQIGKEVYEVGEDVISLFHEENKKELIVMTCWPPGSSEGRIGIRAVVDGE
jgi:LPXTG-site transpeptidase (sortase) family protein